MRWLKIHYIITQQRNTTRRICLFVAWSYKTCGSVVQPLVGSLIPTFSPKIQLTRDKMRSSFWGCNFSDDPPSPLGGKSFLLWGQSSLLSAQLCWPLIVTLWYLPTWKSTQQFIPFNPPCKNRRKWDSLANVPSQHRTYRCHSWFIKIFDSFGQKLSGVICHTLDSRCHITDISCYMSAVIYHL
jgi:hypothetical protein